MKKIDFFGGLHGHYLELVLNVSVFRNQFDISKPMFNKNNGACHVAVNNYADEYRRIIKNYHYSFLNISFDTGDEVIRITCDRNDLLIAITNSFIRAGDEILDLQNLEIDTLNKLNLPKTQEFRNNIIADYGIQKNYPRSALRNYFRSMFQYDEFGYDQYNCFDPATPDYYEFPMRSFFEFDNFYYQLNQVAQWFNENFYPTSDLYNLHQEFINLNHGYNSEVKCKEILSNILAGNSFDFSTNIVEEAWINHRIAKIFRCYNLEILEQDSYPTNTLAVSRELYNWKSNDIGVFD